MPGMGAAGHTSSRGVNGAPADSPDSADRCLGFPTPDCTLPFSHNTAARLKQAIPAMLAVLILPGAAPRRQAPCAPSTGDASAVHVD
eukprot:526308-Pyramimonas_sp.AAC.1